MSEGPGIQVSQGLSCTKRCHLPESVRAPFKKDGIRLMRDRSLGAGRLHIMSVDRNYTPSLSWFLIRFAQVPRFSPKVRVASAPLSHVRSHGVETTRVGCIYMHVCVPRFSCVFHMLVGFLSLAGSRSHGIMCSISGPHQLT